MGSETTSLSSTTTTMSILVVDDDPTCLSIVAATLKKFKYEVVTAKHPRDALYTLRIKRGSLNLVVTDVHMPDMNGFELQQTISQEFNLPVVLMSGDKGLGSNGAAFFISKPVCPDDVKDLWQFTAGKAIHAEKKATSVEEKRESSQEAPSAKKTKLVWTNALHNRFLEAIRSIGLERSVPKKILEVMNVPGLTRENVASHLQKYRIFLRRVSDASYKIQCLNGDKGLSQSMRPSFARSPAFLRLDGSFRKLQHQKPGQGFSDSCLNLNVLSGLGQPQFISRCKETVMLDPNVINPGDLIHQKSGLVATKSYIPDHVSLQGFASSMHGLNAVTGLSMARQEAPVGMSSRVVLPVSSRTTAEELNQMNYVDYSIGNVQNMYNGTANLCSDNSELLNDCTHAATTLSSENMSLDQLLSPHDQNLLAPTYEPLQGHAEYKGQIDELEFSVANTAAEDVHNLLLLSNLPFPGIEDKKGMAFSPLYDLTAFDNSLDAEGSTTNTGFYCCMNNPDNSSSTSCLNQQQWQDALAPSSQHDDAFVPGSNKCWTVDEDDDFLKSLIASGMFEEP